MSRKSLIKSSFARAADSYDSYCEIQMQVAARLAEKLPSLSAPSVLELGCGTGQFTRFLLEKYGDGQLVISDACPTMTARCASAFAGLDPAAVFKTVDGDSLNGAGQFDLIASSLALHWFDDPTASLKRQRALLRPGGRIVFATIGEENFPEWRRALGACGLADGLPKLAPVPGIVAEDFVTINYASARAFLGSLKKTGAVVPRDGYRPLAPRALRQACAALDTSSGGHVTWHIVYGVVEADGAASEQSDSCSRQLVGSNG